MPRQTSIAAYRAIEASGFLGALTFAVYDCLYRYGPMTQNECWKILGWDKKDSIGPRFAELVRYGVAVELPKRACCVSQRQCLTYDVTSHIPRQKLRAKKRRTVWIAFNEASDEGYASTSEVCVREFCREHPNLTIFRACG